VRGVIPEVMEELFARVAAGKEGVECSVRVSFVEIHKVRAGAWLGAGGGSWCAHVWDAAWGCGDEVECAISRCSRAACSAR